MSKPIINIDELEYKTFGKGNRFQADRAQVSENIGAKKLGYSVIRLRPGSVPGPITHITLLRRCSTSCPARAR